MAARPPTPQYDELALGKVSGVYFFSYLSERGRENLPRFKYKGSDASLLYVKWISPTLNSWLAKGMVPRWLHPNVITVTGFLLCVASTLLLSYYSPTFDDPVPASALVFAATCLATYWWLDALDGKQARQLGLGSPLGLLCDHGCDSLNATLMALNMNSCILLGPTPLAYVGWAFGAAGFFFNTWEEWFVGSLDLPLINAPNEGIVVMCAMFLWTACVGAEWWRGPAPFLDGWRRNEAVMVMFVFATVATLANNIRNTVRAVARNRAGGKAVTLAQSQAATNLIAFTRALPFLILLALGAGWCAVSPTDVLGTHPRLLLVTLGLLASKCCTGLMVAHLCDDAYRPYCKTLVACGAIGFHTIALPMAVDGAPGDDRLAVYALFVIASFSFVHQTWSLTREISTLLNINVWTVPAAIRRGEKAQ